MTRLELVSSGVVDMFDTLPISLNYSIADIRQPDKRKASFSKTVKLPATKNNNDLFKHIYEIDGYSNFNPKAKADCVLYQDELVVLDGFMRLISIIVDGDKMEYEVNLIGDTGGFMQAIEGKLLTDIDLSAYDHSLTFYNVLGSWTATVGEGYLYPIIDTGFTNHITWGIETLQPAVYAKQYIDSMFSSAGYTYTSTFFDSDRFKRLVIPYSGGQDKMEGDDVSLRNVEVSNVGSLVLTVGTAIIAFDTVDSDPGSLWIPINKAVGVNRRTVYKLTFNGEVVYSGISFISVKVIVFNASGSSTTVFQSQGLNNAFSIVTPEFVVEDGDAISIAMQNSSLDSVATLAAGYNMKVLAVNKGVAAGDTIKVNNTIPLKIKQKDFFMSLVKMFNLYVSQDKANSNNLIIETRSDYYNTDVVDWTDKQDKDSSLIIKPVGGITARRYIYNYKEDKDYYNTDYQDTYDESIGTKTWNTDNEFLQNDNKTEVIFSPTIMVGERTWSQGGVLERFVYPSISKQSYNQTGESSQSFNIRILYYGGMVGFGGKFSIEADGTKLSIYSYPSVGMLDSIVTPTFDLSFGVPRKVYYTTTAYTNGNLFNNYYKGFIEELTSKDAKIINGKFHLTATDISTLDFRKTYVVGGHYVRLNSVSNYSPTVQGLADVEFVLIKDSGAFTSTTGTTNGGVNIQF